MKATHAQIIRWQIRRQNSKRLIIISSIILTALVIVPIFDYIVGIGLWDLRSWIKLGVMIIVDILFLFSNFSAFSNYTFLYYFYQSQWIHQINPEKLQLVTGEMISANSYYTPYAGEFLRISILTSGKIQSFYIKKENSRGLDRRGKVRLLVHHMIAVDVFNEELDLASQLTALPSCEHF